MLVNGSAQESLRHIRIKKIGNWFILKISWPWKKFKKIRNWKTSIELLKIWWWNIIIRKINKWWITIDE